MESFTVSTLLPVQSNQLYADWLNSQRHSMLTGAEADIQNKIGGKHSSWDGYISGSFNVLVENQRILMSWRTTEFEEKDDSSIVEVLLKDVGSECEITINHSNIPDGQGENYRSGWLEYYFDPIKSFYTSEN